MLGMGLKQLAEERGLTVGQGCAYGNLGGYTVTLSEGMGTKTLGVSVFFPDQAARYAFQMELGSSAVKRKYRIQESTQNEVALTVAFMDNMGTMKRLREFVDWLPPKLREYGAVGAESCPFCRQPLGGSGFPVRVNGVVHSAHNGCIAQAERQTEESRAAQAYEKKNLGRGSLGALIGGLVGTIPWVVAFYFGWFVGWLGFLIGKAAQKGYELAGGKPCKAKLWIVLSITLVCVFIGNFVGYAVTLAVMIGNGELLLAYSDIPAAMLLLFSDGEFWRSASVDIGMGILFAFLGVFGIIKDLRAEQRESVPQVERL